MNYGHLLLLMSFTQALYCFIIGPKVSVYLSVFEVVVAEEEVVEVVLAVLPVVVLPLLPLLSVAVVAELLVLSSVSKWRL